MPSRPKSDTSLNSLMGFEFHPATQCVCDPNRIGETLLERKMPKVSNKSVINFVFLRFLPGIKNLLFLGITNNSTIPPVGRGKPAKKLERKIMN